MNEREEENGSAFWAFLLGSAVGVITGLLIAPRPGKETVERLQDWVDNLRDKGQNVLEQGKDILKQGKRVIQA